MEKLITRLLRRLYGFKPFNRILPLIVSLGIATFPLLPVAIHLTAVADELAQPWSWLYPAVLLGVFAILSYLVYKFKIDTYLVKFALETIEDHSSLLFLFRETLSNRMSRKPEYLYRFLVGFAEDFFGRLTRKLNLVDRRSLFYLSGLNYALIAKTVSDTNRDIARIRIDPNATDEEIDAKVQQYLTALRKDLKRQLESDEFRIFTKSNLTDRQPYIDKMSRVLRHCVLEPSYSRVIDFVAGKLCDQIQRHFNLVTERHSRRPTIQTIHTSLQRELFFWRFVTQARLGYPVYEYLRQASGDSLESALTVLRIPADRDRAFQSNVITDSVPS